MYQPAKDLGFASKKQLKTQRTKTAKEPSITDFFSLSMKN